MIEFYQKQLISLLSPWIVVVNRMKPKTRYRIISLCFFADLVLFCIVRYLLHKESYFYNTALGMIFLCVLAILSLDKTLVLKPWRKSMVISWYGMCLVFTISDVLVTKKVCGLGLILAIHFTAVFFVWQNHSRKDLLWKAFKDAVKWAFVINAVVCFLFRFYVNGGRYAGIFTNPNTFGLYLVIIFAVFMSDLDWNVDTGKRFVKCIPTYVSLALIVFYISASQARTAMMAACGILIMWLVLRGILSVRSKQVKKYLSAIGLLVCFSVALYPVFYLGAKKIPKLVNHPIVFQDDVLYLANGEKIKDVGDRVIAESDRIEHVDVTPKEEQLVDNSIWGRLVRSLDTKDTLNKISSGRITIYKAYDMIFFDWFLLCKFQFFQHYFPETEPALSGRKYGFNIKSQLLKLLVIFPAASALAAWICTLF